MLIPRVEFGVSRAVNEFCHTSVLYSELMPVELATGILMNKAYQARNAHLRRDEIRLELQKAGPFSSESEWYIFATGLMKRSRSGGLESLSGAGRLAETFRKIRLDSMHGFEEIWGETRPRLEEYRERFESDWSSISDHVLSRLSLLAKTPWSLDKIRVHFIDCLYGGFGWADSVGFTPLPDLEIQKKFLAHELSELITPRRIVAEALRNANLDPGIAHTVVDMIAFFSVRDFLVRPVFPNPWKKGLKPNPSYYQAAGELFPMFEYYADNPAIYGDFRALAQDMIQSLNRASASSSEKVISFSLRK